MSEIPVDKKREKVVPQEGEQGIARRISVAIGSTRERFSRIGGVLERLNQAVLSEMGSVTRHELAQILFPPIEGVYNDFPPGGYRGDEARGDVAILVKSISDERAPTVEKPYTAKELEAQISRILSLLQAIRDRRNEIVVTAKREKESSPEDFNPDEIIQELIALGTILNETLSPAVEKLQTNALLVKKNIDHANDIIENLNSLIQQITALIIHFKISHTLRGAEE